MSKITETATLLPNITSVYIDKRTSSKTNADYYMLCTVWNLAGDQTYTQETFLNNEQLALISASLPFGVK